MFWQLLGSYAFLMLLAWGLALHVGRNPDDATQVAWLFILLSLAFAGGMAYLLGLGVRRALRQLTFGDEPIVPEAQRLRLLGDPFAELDRAAAAFGQFSEQLEARIERLEEDRTQLRTVLSGMIEAVVAIDAEQRILFANERADALLEVSMQSFIGRYIWEVVRQRPLLEMVREAMNKDFVRQELTWTGSETKVVTAHFAKLPGPPPRGAVLVFHDTTDLRRLEKLRQEFVANVSHELKTPLTIIQAYVETLLSGVEDADQQRRFLSLTLTEAHRLHSLIVDLLQLARIEATTEVFTYEPVDLDPCVRDCVDRHRMLAAEKRLTVVVTPPSATTCVLADEEAMQQILDNLLVNALKYTPEQGRVEIAWRREGDLAVVQVKDNGIGISEPDLQRIFERFYRVDKARSRELGGTGLGLSIVKHLTQTMRGNVRAESQRGVGSTFTVTLPLAEA